jgi:hypothetical protein
MEYIVGTLIILIFTLVGVLFFSSVKKAQCLKSLPLGTVQVTKEFFESATKVSDIMLNSDSKEAMRKSLPQALSNLEKEVLKSRRSKIREEFAEEVKA